MPFRAIVRAFGLGLAVGGAGCSSTDPGGGAEPLLPCETAGPAWDCELPSPCDDAVFVVITESFEDRGAAVCVAEALGDRRPSRLQLDREVTGDTSSYETIFVVDDEHAVSNRTVVFTFTGQVVTNRQLLQEPAYFDDCAASPTDRALYDCLVEWSIGCGEDPVDCP